jgi:hypothetical protein
MLVSLRMFGGSFGVDIVFALFYPPVAFEQKIPSFIKPKLEEAMKENVTDDAMLDAVKSDLEALEQAVTQSSKLRLIKLTLRSGVKAGAPEKKKSVNLPCVQPLYGVPNAAE